MEDAVPAEVVVESVDAAYFEHNYWKLPVDSELYDLV
jgi:hypothetical protein